MIATMTPNDTLWDAEPHTLAKHAILQAYLQAWFPILARHHGRVVYYDGFAGPGRYSGGQEGSPLVALRVAREHQARFNAQIAFTFVEERQDRVDRLREEVASIDRPTNSHVEIVHDQFEDALRGTLDSLDRLGLQIAPTFALIDPFGINGIPFDLIARLLKRERCEVLITFMNVTLQRFVTQLPEQADRLIGIPDASSVIGREPDSRSRVFRSRQLYEQSLRGVAKYVRFFELRDRGNRPVYDLFFATNHARGHQKMKEAMWKVDGSGEFSFSDGVDPSQAVLFRESPGESVAPVIHRQFSGQTVMSEQVLGYVMDYTAFLDTHTRAALKLMERESPPRITVAEIKVDGTKRRRGSFPPGTLISFSEGDT